MDGISSESILWLAIALIALAAIGWLLLRGMAGGDTKPQPRPELREQAVAVAPPEAVPEVAVVADTRARNAIGVPAAEGPPDDLRRMKGVGPKLVAMLGQLEITRYDQIAGWGPAEIATVDPHLGAFKGRIVRDNWVEQAALLAEGRTAEFESKFGKLDGNLT